ncbi:hypothetical protein BDZ45DRAFT_409528 [Acephala macrosclerotiorum]|nr:hypothetical protein BDZ45DRAFT_409528 [Acephala macrosclerotiorum]
MLACIHESDHDILIALGLSSTTTACGVICTVPLHLLVPTSRLFSLQIYIYPISSWQCSSSTIRTNQFPLAVMGVGASFQVPDTMLYSDYGLGELYRGTPRHHLHLVDEMCLAAIRTFLQSGVSNLLTPNPNNIQPANTPNVLQAKAIVRV